MPDNSVAGAITVTPTACVCAADDQWMHLILFPHTSSDTDGWFACSCLQRWQRSCLNTLKRDMEYGRSSMRMVLKRSLPCKSSGDMLGV